MPSPEPRPADRSSLSSVPTARDAAEVISLQHNELVYRAVDALNQRDLDSFLALCDPTIDLVSHLVKVQGGGHYSGHDGLRTWWQRVLAFSPEFRLEVEKVRDRGEIAVARMRAHCHGWQSDGPTEQIEWNVIKWRERKALSWFVFLDEAEALEAAGLSG
jgi:hypothetical protein